MGGVAGRGGAAEVGDRLGPGVRGRRPEPVGLLGSRQRTVADLEHEVVGAPGLDVQLCTQGAVVPAGVRRPAPPHVQVPDAGRPPSVPVVVRALHRRRAEVAAQAQHGGDVRIVLAGVDPAQEHDPVRVAGVGQGLAGLDDRVPGHPSAAPDQRPGLVVAAPHVLLDGRDGVDPVAAHEVAEHGGGVPGRGAQPADVPAGTDQRATGAVGQEGVLAQGVRRVARLGALGRWTHRRAARAEATPARAATPPLTSAERRRTGAATATATMLAACRTSMPAYRCPRWCGATS